MRERERVRDGRESQRERECVCVREIVRGESQRVRECVRERERVGERGRGREIE